MIKSVNRIVIWWGNKTSLFRSKLQLTCLYNCPTFLCLTNISVPETGMWRYWIRRMKLNKFDKRSPLQLRCRCPRHTLVKVRSGGPSIKWHKRSPWMSYDVLAARPPARCALTSTPFLCLFSTDTHTEVRNQGGRHICKKLTKLKKWNFSIVVFVGSQRDVNIYNFTMGQWEMEKEVNEVGWGSNPQNKRITWQINGNSDTSQ